MKGKKKDPKSELADGGPSFEQAIQQLEKIVAEMESAELPLEQILSRYEEGTRLVRFCGQKLEEAEKKIELLARKSDGAVELEPFEPETDSPRREDEDENKLF